jgi:plastocyanin
MVMATQDLDVVAGPPAEDDVGRSSIGRAAMAREGGPMTMNRRREVLLVAFSVAVIGCGPGGLATSVTSPSSMPASTPVPSVASASPSAQSPTPLPTLASTTEKASTAPAGAIQITLALPDAKPRFQPDHVSAPAGTVVFFLRNVPNPIVRPDHIMVIGPAVGQELARTPRIRPDETVTFTVEDLAPGTYAYWCTIPGLNGLSHEALGMVGSLSVIP